MTIWTDELRQCSPPAAERVERFRGKNGAAAAERLLAERHRGFRYGRCTKSPGLCHFCLVFEMSNFHGEK